MRDHTKLVVWRRAQDFAAEVFRVTADLPGRAYPNLLPQLHTSAASIGSNIAEGAGQPSRAQYARYLGIALGSAQETRSHLYLACRVGMISVEDHDRLERELREIRAMLYALRQRVLQG